MDTNDALYLQIGRMIRDRTLAAEPNLKLIGRMLEILEASSPGALFFSVLRPILRVSDLQIQSKCFLLLARRETDLAWAEKLLDHKDARLRANVIEGLWENKAPGVMALLLLASKDQNHRVVANSAYGLRLYGAPEFLPIMEQMQASEDPMFRIASAWVIRRLGEPELCTLLKTLVRDPDSAVRRAAFETLASLRSR